jgi:hypothetical protein
MRTGAARASMDRAVPLMFPMMKGASRRKTPQNKNAADEAMTAAAAEKADTR